MGCSLGTIIVPLDLCVLIPGRLVVVFVVVETVYTSLSSWTEKVEEVSLVEVVGRAALVGLCDEGADVVDVVDAVDAAAAVEGGSGAVGDASILLLLFLCSIFPIRDLALALFPPLRWYVSVSFLPCCGCVLLSFSSVSLSLSHTLAHAL